MEINEMQMSDIESRLSQISEELNTPEADIDALTEEVNALEERKLELNKEIEERKAKMDAIITGEEPTTVIKTFEEEKRTMNNTFGIDSKEYRDAFLNQIRGIELTAEQRSVLSSSTASVGYSIPEQTQNEILKKARKAAPMLDEVTLLAVAGNVRFAVEGTVADASIHSEGSTASGAADTLVEVTLGGYEMYKLVEISDTVKTMAIDAFEAWLTDMLAEKVGALIDAYLISGTGSSQPEGIDNVTWTSANSITVAKTASLTAANVQTVIGLLPSAYDRAAKFIMSKKTLYQDFMGLQDNAKNAIVRGEGPDGFTVYGIPVVIDDNVTLHEALLGDCKKVVANLPESIQIKTAFDIDHNTYKYAGVAMFDSKVAVSDAFVKITKATS